MNERLKKLLKPILLPPYHWLKKDRLWLRKMLSTIAPTFATKILYRRALGKKIDLKSPKTLNEKMLWLKLNTYYNNELITECVDKYLVRNYIKRMGCKEILNELIGVWDTPDEINFEDLPNKFVLKCNHGCGYNIICTDKSKLNIEQTKKQLTKWLKEDYWKLFAEVQYKFINKKIIAEQFIEAKNNELPIDYKFFCENGRFKTLQIVTDRAVGYKLYYFDESLNYRPDYNLSDKVEYCTNIVPEKPSNISEMIKIVEQLAKPFPFVKVDLYNVSSQIIFSELTFVPYGGFHSTKHADGLSNVKLTDIDSKYFPKK